MTKIEWTNETWNPIPSWPMYEVTANGEIRNRRTKKLIKLRKHENMGHLYFTPKRGKKCYVHRAVLESLVGVCPSGMECRHLDGNPQNNHVSNLAWGTRYENAQDTKKHGKKPKGQNAPFSRFTQEQVKKIRDASGNGLTSRELGKLFSVSHTTIQKIVRGDRYVE